MPDPSYVIETQGRQAGLEFHLQTAFYPPLPSPVREAFVEVFNEYWDYDLDIDGLQEQLKERAGYVGDISSHNLPQFLNEDDLDEDY